MRPDHDRYFTDMARLVASRSTCIRRSVGCVLVDKRGNVLATGYNGVPSGRPHCNSVIVTMPIFRSNTNDGGLQFPHACPGSSTVASGTNLDSCLAIHAEQNAILQCKDAYSIDRAYVTSFPCPSCAKLLLNTSCREIIYLNPYGDNTGQKMWTEAGRLARQFDGEPPMIQRDLVTLFGRDDPLNAWRVVVACICLNLASARVARGIIFRILNRWPTPASMASASHELDVILRPLGLSIRRAKYLRDIGFGWGNTMLDKLPGVGPYALESVAVFVDDVIPDRIGDRKVAAWIEWRKANLESKKEELLSKTCVR